MSKYNVKSLGLKTAGIISAIAVVVLSAFTTVQAQENEGAFVIDEIIAKVDNYIVLKSELDRAYQDYLTNGGTQSEQARCQFLHCRNGRWRCREKQRYHYRQNQCHPESSLSHDLPPFLFCLMWKFPT